MTAARAVDGISDWPACSTIDWNRPAVRHPHYRADNVAAALDDLSPPTW
jgi:hypothetical protein